MGALCSTKSSSAPRKKYPNTLVSSTPLHRILAPLHLFLWSSSRGAPPNLGADEVGQNYPPRHQLCDSRTGSEEKKKSQTCPARCCFNPWGRAAAGHGATPHGRRLIPRGYASACRCFSPPRRAAAASAAGAHRRASHGAAHRGPWPRRCCASTPAALGRRGPAAPAAPGRRGPAAPAAPDRRDSRLPCPSQLPGNPPPLPLSAAGTPAIPTQSCAPTARSFVACIVEEME